MQDDQQQSDDHAAALNAEHRERMITNVVLLLIFGVLVGIGAWLSNEMIAARRADDCISAGRRNCSPIDMQR
jgi:hypothetical protein